MRLPVCVLALALVGAAAPERPLYFDRPLTAPDLAGRSLRELSLMRNTIYARVGNPFRKRWLHAYFAAQPWYHELPAPQLEKLSEVDKQNALILEKAEQATPRAELLARRQALLQAHRLSLSDTRFLGFTDQGLLSQAGDALTLWSLPAGEPLATADLPSGSRMLWAVSRPDGSLDLVVANAGTGVARGLWTPGAKVALEKPVLRDQVSMRAVLPAAGNVALVLADGQTFRVDFAKRRARNLEVASPMSSRASAALADGSAFVIPEFDGATILPVTGKRTRLPARTGGDDFLALSADGKTLLSTHAAHTLRRGAPTRDAQVVGFEGEAGEVLALFATDDGAAIEATTQAIARFGPGGQAWRTAIDTEVRYVAMRGDWIAVAGADHTLRLYDARDGHVVPGFQGPARLADDEVVELVLLSRALGERVPSFVPNVQADRNPLDDLDLLDQLLTVDQLSDLSRRDLKLLRHTVSARRGKAFTVPLLHDYFATKGWYHPDLTFSDAKLSEIDRKNLKIIGSLEDRLGGPLPDNVDHEVIHFGG